MTPRIKKLIVSGLFFAVAVLCVRGFYGASEFYRYFEIVYGIGLHNIHSAELVYFMWFLFFGGIAAVFSAVGLYKTELPVKAARVFEKAAAGRAWPPILLLVSVFGAVVAFRAFILKDAPIADDESTYVFIAKTLLHGRLTNPIPEDKAFFANQFVVMNDHGWFGKYPVGHPLLLAAGEALGTHYLVGPLITCFALWVTYLIGLKMFDRKTALLCMCLLATSPHFLWTGATLLSQTTSTLCMLLGVLFTIFFHESKRARFGFAAGFFFAYAIAARPLPGVLFIFAAFAVAVFQKQKGAAFFRHLKSNARYLAPVALLGAAAVAFLLFVNFKQTGDILKSGYHAVHGAGMGVTTEKSGQTALSVAGSLLRQNFWLFGWPLSLLFVWFMPKNRYRLLVVSMIAAEYLYRVLAPKTVVSTTGPIYVTEIVPLLALATAAGMIELKKKLEKKGFANAGKGIVSVVCASAVISLMCFWPVHLRSIKRGSDVWAAPFETLKAQNIDKALIFADNMAFPRLGVTWAYFPPNPSPSLDDDILFVRIPKDAPSVLSAMWDFKKRRYPDRPAWVLQFLDAKPTLIPLESVRPKQKP